MESAAITLATIVPQRTRADCGVAALATVQGWTYEKAREVLGDQVTEAGACLLPLVVPLLREGIAGTYLMVRDHPEVDAATRDRQTMRKLPSRAEIHALLRGRRALVCIEGGGTNGLPGPGRGHAIAWDGTQAIECGSVGEIERPPSEVDFEDWPLREVLILSELPASAPPPPVEMAPAATPSSVDADSLAALFARHERVFLGFSGGKESIALAHMLEPWRDRVTLLWVNTGHMAPHMVEFVRGYGEWFTLEEVASPNLIEHWQAMGTPAEVFPLANITGSAAPRLQPWLHCCNIIRQEPMSAFLRSQPGPCCFINGQRRQDQDGATVAGLRSRLPATVEVVMPLASWSEDDVFAYVATHGLALPPQYAEGYPDSIECLICPAPMKAARLRYLRRHFPDQAEAAVKLSRDSTQATLAAALAVITAAAEPRDAA